MQLFADLTGMAGPRKTNMSSIIDSFRDEHAFLSNFFPSALVVDGELYQTVEHAFQAAKTDDLNLKSQIRAAGSAREAKRLGRSVPLIQGWDEKRLDIMEGLVKQKFSDHLDLKLRLLLTGDKELVEGNTWNDRFWGKTKDGNGENHLGKILMNVRSDLNTVEGGPRQVFVQFLEDNNLGFLGVKL